MSNELKLQLIRKFNKKNYCIGKLYIEGKYFCDTMEPKDIGLSKGQSICESEEQEYYACGVGSYELFLRPFILTKEEWAERSRNFMPKFRAPGFRTIIMANSKHWEDVYAQELIDAGRRHEFGGPDYTPEYHPCANIKIGFNSQPGKIIDTDKVWDILMDKYLIPATLADKTIQIEITREYDVLLTILDYRLTDE